jgi:hypothetical protein
MDENFFPQHLKSAKEDDSQFQSAKNVNVLLLHSPFCIPHVNGHSEQGDQISSLKKIAQNVA